MKITEQILSYIMYPIYRVVVGRSELQKPVNNVTKR